MRTICLLIVLQITVCAQTSPKHQIIYNDKGGFTTKSEKWIAKRKAKSERRNGEAVANAFEQNMRELSHFPDWLDSVFDDVKTEYGACHDVSRILPSMIHVSIQSGPFPVVGYPPDFLASGVAYQDGRIEIVYWSVSSTVGPQMAVPLLKGELRNWMWWKLHGAPREMWGQSACH
jgi:hypothetical protein